MLRKLLIEENEEEAFIYNAEFCNDPDIYIDIMSLPNSDSEEDDEDSCPIYDTDGEEDIIDGIKEEVAERRSFVSEDAIGEEINSDLEEEDEDSCPIYDTDGEEEFINEIEGVNFIVEDENFVAAVEETSEEVIFVEQQKSSQEVTITRTDNNDVNHDISVKEIFALWKPWDHNLTGLINHDVSLTFLFSDCLNRLQIDHGSFYALRNAMKEAEAVLAICDENLYKKSPNMVVINNTQDEEIKDDLVQVIFNSRKNLLPQTEDPCKKMVRVNMGDVSPHVGGDDLSELRSIPFEEGGDDTIMDTKKGWFDHSGSWGVLGILFFNELALMSCTRIIYLIDFRTYYVLQGLFKMAWFKYLELKYDWVQWLVMCVLRPISQVNTQYMMVHGSMGIWCTSLWFMDTLDTTNEKLVVAMRKGNLTSDMVMCVDMVKMNMIDVYNMANDTCMDKIDDVLLLTWKKG